MDSKEKYLTIDEVAAISRVKPETIRRRLVKGTLPGFKFGRLWRIRESDILKIGSFAERD